MKFRARRRLNTNLVPSLPRKLGRRNSNAPYLFILKLVYSSFFRSRSRSPGDSRARLPPEVLQQLEFGLVEPNPESLRGEIPFTNVETSVASKYYYTTRSRHMKTATTRSVVSAMEASSAGSTNGTNSNSDHRLHRAETLASISGGSGNGIMPKSRPM